jgi:DeoR family transcriptional regulator, glucitol operon repressor
MENRRQKLLSYLQTQGRTSVNALADIFETSGATIRSDLRALEDQGVVVRRYGSAEACSPKLTVKTKPKTTIPSLAEDRSMDEKQSLNPELKEKIGEFAASLINDGESVILDCGSTTLQIVPHLDKKRALTLMTNSMHIVNALAQLESEHTVVVSGGTYRRKSASFHGSMAEEAFTKYTFDKLFIGADGFDINVGTTTYNEAYHISRSMRKAAKKTFIVMDHHKLGRRSPNIVIPLEDIDAIVTDSGADPAYLEELRQRGIEVYVV